MKPILKKPEAQDDLIEIATYFYLAEPESDLSERFLRATEQAFQRLGEYPGIGASIATAHPRLQGIRRWPIPGFRNYLILSRETPTAVEIIRVIHGSRDIPGLFEETGED